MKLPLYSALVLCQLISAAHAVKLTGPNANDVFDGKDELINSIGQKVPSHIEVLEEKYEYNNSEGSDWMEDMKYVGVRGQLWDTEVIKSKLLAAHADQIDANIQSIENHTFSIVFSTSESLFGYSMERLEGPQHCFSRHLKIKVKK